MLALPNTVNESDITKAVSLDWRRIVKVMRISFTQNSKNTERNSEYVFGFERVSIKSQAYCLTHLNFIWQNMIFGNEFDKLQSPEFFANTDNIIDSRIK